MSTPITIAYGDGIGPEIMEGCLSILKAANAQVTTEVIEIGEKIYKQGVSSGIRPEAWESIKRNKVFLKSPITTPQGGGVKSLNVTIRKGLGLFANIRPCVSYYPFVKTLHPGIDCIIVRENEEDLYAGIEYQQSDQVFHAIKLVSKPGTERIIRYAFEYARAYNRKKVSCLTKDNILKITDGYFHKRFVEIAKEYPELETEHLIIDIGTAKLAVKPQRFDVVVTLNLYGDIISDVVAEVAGSVGLGGSANIGELASMFEAIHGSAPDLAGKDLANPSGLLHAAIMMLVHIGQSECAAKIFNAWASTLESGIHTGDIAQEGVTKQLVGTKEFSRAVIEHMGQTPHHLAAANFKDIPLISTTEGAAFKAVPTFKKPLGVDIYIDAPNQSISEVADKLKSASDGLFKLKIISNRGLTVWPERASEGSLVDSWRCRFLGESKEKIPELMTKIASLGLDIVKHECLYEFNGERAYSLAQGE